MRRRLFAATIIASLPNVLAAQYAPLDSLSPPSSLAAPISLRLQRTALRIAVSEIASKAQVSIAFDPLLDGLDRVVNIDAANVSAARVLMRTLGDTPLQAMTSTSGSIVLAARPRTERRIVTGTIRQPSGPVPGVHVSLVGTRFETATDPTGRFTFGAVPAGRYGLRAQRMGFAPIDQQIQIGDGEPSLDLTMQPIAVPVAAVIVTPGYFGVMQPGLAASQVLTRQQIETVPQLGEDVYRAIGRVPGVARDDFSAKFTVRGEPGEGLAVTLDGLPLIEPFHLKDIGAGLSIIDLWSLGGAELITGGPSAEVGDEIGGAFRMRTVEARGDRTRGSVGLSLTNFRGGAQGTFANGNGSWLASGRRGYLDLAFKLAQIEDSIKPTYNDGFIKVAYALPGGGRVAAHVLHAGDKFRYRDAREPSVESQYRSDYAWMTLEGRLGDRIRQQSVAWIGDLDWAREGLQAGTNGNLLHLRIDDRRSLRTFGVKQDWSLELGSRAMLKFGGVLRRDDASYDYSRLARRQALENRTIVTRVDSSAVAIDPSGDRYEMYVAQRVRPVDALTVEAGVRYDRATHTGDAIVSPRVNASWQPTRGTTVRGSWGKHAQSQSVFGLQVEDGVQTFSTAERANQAVVGIDQALLGGLTARVEAYDRTTTHVRPRYVNAGSNIVMFPEIENDRLLLTPTEGRSRGVEMSISRDAGRRADWSASYTIASAKQHVNGVWLPRLTDQPRAINADWSFHPIANSWRLSLSAVWHSGWPYTPDRIQVDTIVTPQGQFAYATFFKGVLYSERVPSYQRMDARWTRFIDTRTGRLSFFVEVYNLLNNTNLRDRYTSVNINRTNVTYFNGTRSQLPRIPSFGFNWEF